MKATKKRPRVDDSTGPPTKRGRPKQRSLTLTRYPPLRDTANDNITLSRNLDVLHKEMEKENTSKEKMLSLCRQTFGKRREAILDEYEEVTTKSLLREYPELHKNYVVRL